MKGGVKYLSTIAMIEAVLEEKVKPDLLEHEGNIKVVSFEDSVLKVKLLGRCAGCPSASITTEELVAKTVMENIPGVKDVILIQEVSQEILEFAKMLLNK